MNWRSFFLGLLSGLLSSAIILAGNGRLERYAIPLTPAAGPPGVRISIQGAVASPGVYRLPPGSILEDALQAAGGLQRDADAGRLNPASPLVDGQEVRVPVRTPTPASVAADSKPDPSSSGHVNLNLASAAELDDLPGIGPVLAQRIVDYRDQAGPFQSAEDLLKVKGIGSSLLAKIRDLVEAP
jgi:competence protein ComEA